ncbi:MAG: type II secretion system protein [Fimbriimonadales bacterium]
MRKRGFSLIELLVIVAIIAILVALLFPVLNTARRQSYASVCLSNLRQLNSAVLLYLNDHSEMFPPGLTVAEQVRTLWGVLNPYMRNYEIALCPAETQPTQLENLGRRLIPPGSIGNTEPSEVALMPNWCLFVDWQVNPNYKPVNLAEIPYPTDTGVWQDGYLVWVLREMPMNFFSGIMARHGQPVEPLMNREVETARIDRVQVGFLDGHSRSLPARLRPDIERGEDYIVRSERPLTIDGKRPPVWQIQGSAYHLRAGVFGWPVEPPQTPNRTRIKCYVQNNRCEE